MKRSFKHGYEKVFCVGALLLLLLVGCGVGSSDPTPDPVSPTPEPSAEVTQEPVADWNKTGGERAREVALEQAGLTGEQVIFVDDLLSNGA